MNVRSIAAGIVAGGAFAAVVTGGLILDRNINRRCEQMKEIKAKDPDRYYRLLEQTAATKDGIYMSTGLLNQLWAGEASKMNDSLTADSLAKANYAKGLIAVDSLKK